MITLKKIAPICFVLFFVLASSSTVFAYSFNPPDEKTGAPGENNCSECHSGNSLNAAGGSLVLTVPKTYNPGEVYDIVVKLSRSGQTRWGFQMTALTGTNVRAGTFASVDNNTDLADKNSRQYIEHNSAGTGQGISNTHSWTFKWTAPANNIGPINFYAAGNAANNNFGTSGDYIYTQSATSEVPVYGVTLTGVGDVEKQTDDASSGISYTLRVENTGNVDDTISLTTSGDVSATLSQNSLSLAAGASTNVSISISGSALSSAGEYEVNVKATSQGDNTKTAEVTTTTTILPTYNITLAGIGDLTTETSDASTGVSYRFRVTNTGNTDDTVRLTTSGDVTATVSPTTVSLTQGGSQTVTLTISGTSLAKAGNYAVKFTATSQGDDTVTVEETTTTTILPVYSIALAGVGELMTETSDASEGVSYTLTVTNNGNTDDVIDLSTSGTDATLSETEVSLDAGASFEVVLTISGDDLAIAGSYEVKVTATSQGDNTQTAEVTTTTTIFPVYSIALAGVGELMTETSDASDGISYTLTITNNGNTDDVIDLSTSGTDATLSETEVSLDAGASSEVVLTIAGDDLAIAGSYEVKVTATSQGDDIQTLEVTTTTTILPVYSIALAGVGELMTETSDASDGISYTLMITNNGNTDDVIDLSTSGTDATLSETEVSLDAGASSEVMLTISGDDLAIAGSYEVKVTATSQGDDTQTLEVATTTTILPVYSIALAGVGDLMTETSDASEGISYTLTITNNGNTDDIIDLSTSGTDATLSETEVSLGPGASSEVVLTIAGDDLAIAGSYEVKVTATSQGDNTQTAEVATTTTILPVYNIALAGVGELMTETSDASEGVSYKLNITNNGNTDDVIDLSTSGTEATLSETDVSLDAGASSEVVLTISGDDLAIAGSYEVKVTATSQGDNTQTAEVTTTTTILPVYSIALAGVGDLMTETSDASEGVSYTLTITNNGNTDDVIDLSTSGTDATLNQTEVSLDSGTSTEVTLTISGESLMMAGEYEVIVTAVSQGDKTKSVEVSTTTTIQPVYGFTFAGVGEMMTETSDASEGVSYILNITNTGNTDDVIELTTEGTAATLSETEISLAFNTTKEVTLTIAGDVLATSGNYEVKVIATSQGDNAITADVSTTTTILPVYGVMLEVEGALTGATTDSVAGITYTLKVTNTGNTEDTIILGSSAEFGIGGAVLGSFSQPDVEGPPTSQFEITLAPGMTENVLFTASGDLLTQPGEYAIIVTATSTGDSTKSAEITTSTTITAIPPAYGVTLQGEGELTGTTMDILTGETYALLVTNTGNTEDTILLGSSAEVGIEGSVLGTFSLLESQELPTSQLSIIIAPETTEKVLFTVSGDSFTKSGEYEITVTATSQGDDTKTAEITTTTTVTPVYSVKLEGKDVLTGDTMDAIEGVSYVLIVSNDGNTDDTVVLSSSAEVGIEGSVLGSFIATSDQETPSSQIEVMLSPGTSTEVTFTAAGDFFTKSGEYEITVTATSQGDNTKTAEITTTTTVTPVYSVKLEGKDALTGETTDAIKGVSYVLLVSNDGNTDDTVVLSSSAEVGIEGSVLGSFTTSSDQETPSSQIEVVLSSGASTEVTFTAAGDFFTKSGEYEITVTATSQGDNTKTAEITTTTTVTPVYSVKLEGKDALTGDTMDAIKGVSYVLIVSNDGNTDDTIVLSSSAAFGIEGSVLGSFTTSSDQETPSSQIEVMLSSGTSTEVTFTAAGDSFTKPGEYEIVVTATSKADETQTAELTITTTISPVPWDVNADGTVNILDLVQVRNQFGESGEGLAGDVNNDGQVNILDLVEVASYLGKSQAEIIQENQ